MPKLFKVKHAKSKIKRSAPDNGDAVTRALSHQFLAANRVIGSTHRFKRTFNMAGNCAVDGSLITAVGGNGYLQFSSATAGPNYGWITVNPQLFQVPSSGDFTNLFDEFRMIEFVVRLTPYNTVSTLLDGTSFATANNGALVHSCVDYDGNGAISFSTTSDLNSVGAIRQYESYKMAPFFRTDGKSYVVRCPAPAVQLDVAASGQVVHSPWLNQTFSAKPHYGVIIFIEMFAGAAIPSQTFYFKGEVECTFEFRGEI